MIKIRIGLLGIAIGIIALFFVNRDKSLESTEFKNVDGHAEARAKWLRSRLVDPQTGEIPVNMRQRELTFAKTLPKSIFSSKGSRADDSLSYIRRGPQNAGGRTRALAVDLSNTSNILAGGVSGGMWRSTNFGLTWSKVSSNDYVQNISCIVQDSRPGKKDVWYAGTGEGRGSLTGNDFTLLGNGLLKSTNKGVTWTPLASTQVEKVNNAQKLVIAQKIIARFGEDLTGFTFGIWGLAFKPGTDDMREAPAIYIIKELVNRGAKIKAYDPKAIDEAKEYYLKEVQNITYVTSKYEALKDADALVLLTEWKEFRSPDFQKIKAQLKTPVIFDGRNQYNTFNLKEMGIEYYQIGKIII